MTLDVRRIHEAYPYLAERTYLNTAAAGLSWVGEGAAAASFYSGAKSKGINGRDEWQGVLRQAIQRVRSLLGGFDGEINFFGNTSEVVNLVAHSIEWNAGDEIVLAADEFPSVVFAWQHSTKAGAIVRYADEGDEASRTERILAQICERTKVVAVSHVHWATGTAVDIERIGKACREHDALLVVDGVQALGAIPVEMRYVDVYCSAVFKWLCSGFGLSIAAISERAASRFCPAFLGYANAGPAGGLQYAHMNYPGIYALNATLGHMEQLGWSDIYTRVNANWSRLAMGLKRLGYTASAPEDRHAGIVSIEIENSESVRDSLKDKSIDVEARFGLLRVSPHFYNSDADVDRLLDAIATI
ncbi:aminotransferase class V-fold PLP-dependent enzyme [Burkholderia sp. Ax-1719]|uniref:aminotransferase class V-fold PLP-dependent enzyme n=1 Tax=Burkholderia sp. Ax-1719 TaxID=2608334 RepID=UPI00141DCD0E|nr:aminotransferase class V-fold PLP-dependent enzyme [Burkholderia sp. Ax-1719]NIE66925.1 aminotransferase class V-fold PLP-dependent enzyme [Burkholderia sp. Ax-1719]